MISSPPRARGVFFKTTTKCPRFIREEEMDGGWVERVLMVTKCQKVVKVARS